MNFEKLLKDENFQTKVDTLIGNVAKGVSEAIPDDMLEKVKKMEQMADVLEAFLTSVRAEAAVKELSKLTGPKLKDLEDLRETLEKDNKKDELTFKEFVEALDKLKKYQGGIIKLQEDYNKFLSQSTLPDEFKAYISTTEGALKHLKDENQLKPEMKVEVTDLLSKILETVTNAVNGLVTKILPCGNMHYVLEALVATGCSSSGLVTRFFGWALALTLSILFSFLSFVGLYNLWCVQSHQIKRFYGP
ncbi:unnamed protein product [Taenia asiatica]|uniref:EF-hand domain-containing protein n=1 Tax=Taenia asiatica TaxID=60517 RepID=A0A0R3VXE4_TAEAS|nr:unnamed protein product [Taenia asiatica]